MRLAQHPEHPFNSPLPYNTGIMVSGPSGPPPSEQTIVVTGTPRGGTTMIAEALAILGLPMGVTIPPPQDYFNYEDPEFQGALHAEEPEMVDTGRLRELVDRRNRAYSVWGFKLPMAINSLGLLERELRNPRFIFVFRDLVAISSRETIAAGIDGLDGLRRALKWQGRMVDFLGGSSSPCLLLSYEKGLQFPKLLLESLLGWCGLPTEGPKFDEACASVTANSAEYLRGVRYQCDAYHVPAPAGL